MYKRQLHDQHKLIFDRNMNFLKLHYLLLLQVLVSVVGERDREGDQSKLDEISFVRRTTSATSRRSRSSLRAQDYPAQAAPRDSNNNGTPDACVSILVYKDQMCLEGPIRTMTFPTYSAPGSPCCKFCSLLFCCRISPQDIFSNIFSYHVCLPTQCLPRNTEITDHDPSWPGYSAKDQYCDLSDGTWHETDFVGSDKCHVRWYQHFYSPQKLVFSHDTCVGGYQLAYCRSGSCPSDNVITGMPNPREHPVSFS